MQTVVIRKYEELTKETEWVEGEQQFIVIDADSLIQLDLEAANRFFRGLRKGEHSYLIVGDDWKAFQSFYESLLKAYEYPYQSGFSNITYCLKSMGQLEDLLLFTRMNAGLWIGEDTFDVESAGVYFSKSMECPIHGRVNASGVGFLNECGKCFAEGKHSPAKSYTLRHPLTSVFVDTQLPETAITLLETLSEQYNVLCSFVSMV